MGEPIKIVDIATKLINFSGLKAGKDVEIVFIGLRPGEKLHEELYWQGEGIVPTENKKITMLKPNGLNSEKLFSQIERLKEYEEFADVNKILNLLMEIVPEARISHDRSGHFFNDRRERPSGLIPFSPPLISSHHNQNQT
jgi:FlaA1/EpsC-like NDP-sugar epimerase